jgi:hypothetical protein
LHKNNLYEECEPPSKLIKAARDLRLKLDLGENYNLDSKERTKNPKI